MGRAKKCSSNEAGEKRVEEEDHEECVDKKIGKKRVVKKKGKKRAGKKAGKQRADGETGEGVSGMGKGECSISSRFMQDYECRDYLPMNLQRIRSLFSQQGNMD